MSGTGDPSEAPTGLAENAVADGIRVSRLMGDGLRARLDDVAALRVALARGWPELRETDRAAEKNAVAWIAAMSDGTVLGAFRGDRIVGMALGAGAGEESAEAFRAARIDPVGAFELRGAFVLPRWRGRGIGTRLLAMREAVASKAGYTHACARDVIRGAHPRRPAEPQASSERLRRHGYVPVGTMTWRLAGGRPARRVARRRWRSS